jgi:hypothetical protein
MNYEKGEVVWAKIKGYPWWPAVVGLNFEYIKEDTKILVNFIGENSQLILSIYFKLLFETLKCC